jgi:hypothetical protein
MIRSSRGPSSGLLGGPVATSTVALTLSRPGWLPRADGVCPANLDLGNCDLLGSGVVVRLVDLVEEYMGPDVALCAACVEVAGCLSCREVDWFWVLFRDLTDDTDFENIVTGLRTCVNQSCAIRFMYKPSFSS